MSEISLVTRAILVAEQRHRGAVRKGPDATPYIRHPIEVADLLGELGYDDPGMIAAALLHDVLEDTVEDSDTALRAVLQDLVRDFGVRVVSYVVELTDVAGLSKQEHHAAQCSRTYTAEAARIKIADKTCNVRNYTTLASRDAECMPAAVQYALRAAPVVAHARGFLVPSSIRDANLLSAFYRAHEALDPWLRARDPWRQPR